eukprot:9635885-Alexandrium_andersonii.AAC.1
MGKPAASLLRLRLRSTPRAVNSLRVQAAIAARMILRLRRIRPHFVRDLDALPSCAINPQRASPCFALLTPPG